MNISLVSSRPVQAILRLESATEFKRMDKDGKGNLSKQDFSSAVVRISAEGARKASLANSPNLPDQAGADKAFARIDADGNGQLSATEFEQAGRPPGERPALAAGASSGQRPRRPPPAGPPPGGGGARSEGAQSGNTSYAAADSNRDGTVSAQEQQAYDAQSKAKAQASAGTKASELAAQAYRSVAAAS